MTSTLEIRTDLIRQRAVQLLRAEDEAIHLLLASMGTALRRWIPFDDHDTSDRQGVLAEHTQAEVELAGVLVQLIHLVCQPDQDPSPQAEREALAEQLGRHLQPMCQQLGTADAEARRDHLAALLGALSVWMHGKPAGAQLLANALCFMPGATEQEAHR